MDEFDFKDIPEKKPFRLGAALLNCASLFLTLGALAVIGFYALIFLNPNSEFNPLPPAPVAPTQAPTLAPAEPTPEPQPTATPEAEPTATPQPVISFGLQPGDNPSFLNSTIFYPERECNFMAVAGQVFEEGGPIAGLQVRVTGSLNGEPVDKTGLTGAASQYGGGQYYEVQLADQPIASSNALQVTLLDAEGQPISAAHSFSTSASCEENLVMINFTRLP
ncbi:MAG: hypothetical protein KIS85_01400 [Anaerolineales bacterium]|nr:hypothetical protein [Anaerolineales bacterium]